MTAGALVPVRPVCRVRSVRQGARPRGILLLVVALGLLLASCSSFGGAVDTEEALRDAGFAEASVDISTSDGFDEVDVMVDPGSLEGDADTLSELAAGVVWTNFPLRFDDLRIVLRDSFEDYETFYTYDELFDLFGPRPSGFDERSIGDDFARGGLIVAIIVGVGLLLFVAVAVVAAILIVRASKRRAATLPPPWPPQSGASQWPPQSGPPPGASQWPPQVPRQQPPPTAGPGTWAPPREVPQPQPPPSPSPEAPPQDQPPQDQPPQDQPPQDQPPPPAGPGGWGPPPL